jgi:putative ABC transport system substrate-binding protein
MGYSAVGAIVTLIVSLLTTPHSAEAQQTRKVYRVGVLSFGSAPPGPLDAFTKGLNELGYVEGRNLAIEWRFADGSNEKLAAQADELVRLEVDAIFAINTPAAQAAKRATTAIPIVIARVADPVGSGLVSSIARPDGNITGLTSTFPDLGRKRLELLKEALPDFSRVAVMWNPRNEGAARTARQMEVASQQLHLQFHGLEVHTPDDFLGALQAATRGRAEAVAVIDDVFMASHKLTIVDLAAQHALPLVSVYGEFAEAGALMAYGPSMPHTYRHAAQYVDKVLKGTKPRDLPIEQPTKYDLVINLKTAKALGLRLSPVLLFQADEVIR